MPGTIISHGQQVVGDLMENAGISLQWVTVLVGTSQIWNEKRGKVYVYEFIWTRKTPLLLLA